MGPRGNKCDLRRMFSRPAIDLGGKRRAPEESRRSYRCSPSRASNTTRPSYWLRLTILFVVSRVLLSLVSDEKTYYCMWTWNEDCMAHERV